MRQILLLCMASLTLALAIPRHAPAEARSIRWDQIMGANHRQMNAEQRTRASALMRREYCYFGCSRSVARCLEASPPSRTARRLGGYVVRQVLAGRTDEQIREGIRQRSLSAHPLETVTIDTSNAQCVGPAAAPVTIVEYADFECPFCRIISPIMHRLVQGMSGNVRLCFKHFPVRGHERALPSSIAALAAARQGRFWQMHNALYGVAPRLEEANLLAAARQAGVQDIDRWNRDRRDTALRQQIEADKVEGLRNGVSGTPTIFINGKEYLGQKNEVELRDRLQEELDITRGQA